MGNIITYNSWEDKAPFGALKLNQEFRITVKVNENYNVKDISWVISKEDVEIDKISLIKENKKYYNGEFSGFNEIGLYFYYFKVEVEIEGEIKVIYYGKNIEDGSCVEYQYNDINKYQITVYDEYNVPTWYKEGILYHIFIDRFNNGNRNKKINNPKKNSFLYGTWDDTPMYIKNEQGDIVRWDFHGGNLKGIIEKLGYLKKLGVSIIYLSPVFEASSNHKYDTGDYKKIDSMFGDEEIFKELIDKAKSKGINIILDGVFSHTGADSKYFNKYNNYNEVGAYQSNNSKYRDWYTFKDNNEEYESWWGVKDLPNVNELNETYMNYIINGDDSVINKWTSMGVKGWRLDVCDELPSEFIKEFKVKLKNIDSEAVLVGEVWEDASNKISYNKRRGYLLGKELDSVMGYPFRKNILEFLKGVISSNQLNNKFLEIKENYPKEAFKSNLNLLGSHDVTRIKTELNEDNKLLKLAVAIQMTFEGVPYIYYGDEAGLCGKTDPDNRRTYPWKHEDKNMIEFYKSLTTIRNKYKALLQGETKFINTKNDAVFSYIRYTSDEKILIIINKSDKEECIDLNLGKEAIGIDLIKGVQVELNLIEKEADTISLIIPPKDFKIINIK